MHIPMVQKTYEEDETIYLLNKIVGKAMSLKSVLNLALKQAILFRISLLTENHYFSFN